MKKVIIFLIISQICLLNYSQIIVDHTVVNKYNEIPAEYMTKVKQMWLAVPGESHAYGYMRGLVRLETLNPAYDVKFTESGSPEVYTSSHLRASLFSWGDYTSSSGWINDNYGEEDWFTNPTAIARTKAMISYCHTNGLTIGALGFGWCTDMFYGTPSATTDPVYGCHWSGASKNGPQGNRCWGLDAADNTITANTVTIETYLNATQEYVDYCIDNNIPTKVFFTTGPVDGLYGVHVGGWTAEKGYVAHLKMESIRNYVKTHPSTFLFDYADILCYDDNGTPTTTSWNGHTYPIGTVTNCGKEETGHITYAGSVRLAKALWWMLARMAGWDGGTGTSTILVGGITVTGAGGATTITSDKGTLQLSAEVTPSNATNKTVTWSISNNTGQASISSAGLVTAVSNGTVTAKATTNDGSGVYNLLVITISNQVNNILVGNITVTGTGGATVISNENGSLQLSASVAPVDATNNTVTWSISNGTGHASISSSGLVTAIANGTVTARANANDGSGIYGTLLITILGQSVLETKNLGNTDIFRTYSIAGNRLAMPVTCTELGDIQSISIYHNGGTGRVLLGVYSDQLGAPASLIGVTERTTKKSTAGWQTVSLISPVAVSSGQTVWLTWVFEINTGVRYKIGTPSRAFSKARWSGGMPATFGSAEFANYRYSVYCTYNTSGSKSGTGQSDINSANLVNDEVTINQNPTDDNKGKVVIYPNPTNGSVTLKWDNYYDRGLILTIYNLQGTPVKKVHIESEINEIQVDLNNNQNGIYLLELKEIKGKVINSLRIIKLRL